MSRFKDYISEMAHKGERINKTEDEHTPGKDKDGKYIKVKSAYHKINVGDTVYFEGPMGKVENFVVASKDKMGFVTFKDGTKGFASDAIGIKRGEKK